MRIFMAFPLVLLAGCAFTSNVIDTGNGTYLISSQASPLRGGPIQAGMADANKFCAKQKGDTHAILLERRQSNVTINGTDNHNHADVHFRCGQ